MRRNGPAISFAFCAALSATVTLNIGCAEPQNTGGSTGQIPSANPSSSGPTGSAGPTDSSGPTSPATPLDPKTPVERELRAGETHTYSVQVPADHVVMGVVDQRGIDVAVRLVEPSGKTIATIDSPNGMQGPEPWTIEPKPAGMWRVEVAPLEAQSAGHYEISVKETITIAEQVERRAKLRYRSGRLFELWKDLRKDGNAAMDRFAKQTAEHAPIAEPIEGDPRGDVLLTFVFLAEADTHYVGLIGGPIGAEFEHNLLRFEDSNLWYLSVRVPKDLRVSYAFRPGDPPNAGATRAENEASMGTTRPDPWNPRRTFGRSIVELPDAPAQPWTVRKPGVTAGHTIEKTIHSKILAGDYKIGVYVPAKLDTKSTSIPYVIVFDGEVYGHLPDSIVPTPVILDNLIAEGKVPPMLGVLVDSGGTRNRDLPMSAPFCEFLAKELVPWLRDEQHVSKSPSDAILAGSSFGGLAAAYCAFHQPETFGNALSQSGSFWFVPGTLETDSQFSLETGAMMREIIAAPKKPIRFWMEVGLFEGGGNIPGGNMVAQNRHLRDVLLLKGYDVSYHEFSGGHDYASWRGSLADGLMTLANKPAKK